MGLIQVLENETFDTVSHREFLRRIKKVELIYRDKCVWMLQERLLE